VRALARRLARERAGQGAGDATPLLLRSSLRAAERRLRRVLRDLQDSSLWVEMNREEVTLALQNVREQVALLERALLHARSDPKPKKELDH
jgi:hypothetical protein